MSHEIETAWIGGEVAAWWDSNKEFWQQELMDPLEAYEKGGIDWGVDLVPIEYNGEEQPWSLVVRDKDDKVLSCVGPDFTPMQNIELLEFMMSVTKAGFGLKVTSAMSLKGGQWVAICARRPDPVTIADEDHLQYFTGCNVHTPYRSPYAYFSDMRAVCANTLRASEKGAQNVFKFRHSGNMEEKVAKAREILEVGFQYQDTVVEVGNKLALCKMSEREFEKFLKKARPVTDSQEQEVQTKMLNTREGVRRVYSDTPDLENLRGTAWGAMQAVIQFNDHERNYQSDDNRFIQAITQDNWNQKAYDILKKEYQIA